MATIRPATNADLEAVQRLLAMTWHDTYDATMGQEKVDEISGRWHRVEALARDLAAAGSLFLIAEEEGAIAGHAYAAPSPGGGARLSRLYVLPTHQGRGLGALLLDAVVLALPEAHSLVLEVEETNVAARRFYGRHGFAVTGRTASCGRDSGVPAILMERRLDRGHGGRAR